MHELPTGSCPSRMKPLTILSLTGLTALCCGQARPTLNVGDPAPSIRVAKWIKNGPALKGRITVVEFWATWCGPCRVAIPHLTQLAKKHRGRVEFVGVDVLETGEFVPKVERMVAEFGPKMDYHVALDDAGFMENAWLKASGEDGIPATYIVDEKGRLAWIGHPDALEPVLDKMLRGTWSNATAAAERAEGRRLASLDDDAIARFNPLVRDPQATLAEVEKLLATEPKLTYRRHVGHFTMNALVKSDEAKAMEFGKAWIDANRLDPPYGDLVDLIDWKDDAGPALVAFAARSLEEQARRFPTLDRSAILSRASTLYLRAGDRPKALAAVRKALEHAKITPGYDPEKTRKLAESVRDLHKNP